MIEDARSYAPAAVRKGGPILGALQRHLPSRGLVLEVASGTDEHISHFAGRNPDLISSRAIPNLPLALVSMPGPQLSGSTIYGLRLPSMRRQRFGPSNPRMWCSAST